MTNGKFPKLVLLLCVIFIAAGCNQQSSNDNTIDTQNTQQSSQGSQTVQQPENNSGTVQQGKPVSGEPIMIQVTQTVQGTRDNNVTFSVAENTTALILLRMSHTVVTEKYDGAGEFVKSIDAIQPSSKQFWAFYVNGKQAQVGAGSYKLQAGDKVEWKLEDIR